MIELMIDRFAQLGNALHGRFWIDGQWVCDSLENADDCISEGEYSLAVRRVESEGCRRILVGSDDMFDRRKMKDDGLFDRRKAREVTLPMFRSSNGTWGLHGGDISLGCCEHLGYILRCEPQLELLLWRLAKSQGRRCKCNAVLRVRTRPDIFIA